ncbi:MAG TPA: beta-ketoacyl synthase N-terminal-like domain-containing protein, partial [Bacillota bacterium]|nr:beta-ketoacyl synthase N-terminal-like domain-containing protein [Bacillota bacterium]
MKTVTKYIYNQVAAKQLALDEAKTMLKELQDLASNMESEANSSEVAGAAKVAQAVSSETAIIGIACRFPKAANPDEFWNNIINKINCIDNFPPERSKDCLNLADSSLMAWMIGGNPQKHESGAGAPGGDNIYVKKGYLPEIDKFDAPFFRISPKEAMNMDPPQRIFLETAYEAMEDAGYGGQNLYGARVGVYAGTDHTHPTMYRDVTKPDEMQLAGSWTGVLASRISYIFNFRGPSMVIDTACSSGLVALHEACRALNNKECDTAIAGGVQIQIFTDIKSERSMELDLMEARDEQVRTFDKSASGTVLGEGAAALILKPLEKAIADHDHIYAVIKGSAVNNDGASGGITAPNAEAQKDVIIRAWKEAKINPETISYIETHGTGTSLGDPIEIKGITSAFAEFTTKKQFCGVGSVKTNLGHLVAASGIASVIKVILALQKNELPPSLNFNSPNPFINFVNSPVYVNNRPRKWNAIDGSPRRAGVSSFGLSGTNCHVILEEAPRNASSPFHETASSKSIPPQAQPEILTIAARNKTVLQESLKRFHRYLAQNPAADLGDICYTANTGRGHYNFRIALLVADLEDLKQKIAILNDTDPDKSSEPGIYFGSYKIVQAHGARENGPAENELTENERRQLNSKAALTLKEFLAAGGQTDRSRESAAELCQAYIKGADIAWNQLYQDRGFTRTSLPPYPLERIRYWAEPNSFEVDEMEFSAHPLFHKLFPSSPASYYGFTWLPAELATNASTPRVQSAAGGDAGSKAGNILVFKDARGIADPIIQGLKATGRDLIEVETGSGYAQITENKYRITGEAGDYQKLVAALCDQKIVQILHLMSIAKETKPEETLTELEAIQLRGLYSLFYLSRALAQSNDQDQIDLVLIADNVNEVTKEEEWLNPASAAFFGLGKVVVFENARLRCRAIDIDQHTPPDKIVAEILTPGSAYQVAYRHGQRFIKEFRPLEFPKKPGEGIKNGAPIRSGGCYILTGGTGGIGLEIGKRLAGKAKVNLALINRTAMPGREIWNEILTRGEDQKLCAKIAAIREMEQAGAEVLTLSADIASESSLKPVLDQLRQKFGQINGIIHAAGAAGFEFMTGKDFRNFKNVTSPKIEGTWLLDKLTDADDLDFFILFSSVVTLTGGAG